MAVTLKVCHWKICHYTAYSFMPLNMSGVLNGASVLHHSVCV